MNDVKLAWGLQGHKNTEERSKWETPWALFKYAESALGVKFILDAAASAVNRKCLLFYDEKISGLTNPWQSWTWCNPPYTQTAAFVKKAVEEKHKGMSSVVMTYAVTDVAWFHEFFDDITEVIFIKGRVKSIDPDTGKQSKKAPAKGHMLVVFDASVDVKDTTCSVLDYKNKTSSVRWGK